MNKGLIKYTEKNFKSGNDLQKFLIETVEDKKFLENLKLFSYNNKEVERCLDKESIVKICENLVKNLKKVFGEELFLKILNNNIKYDGKNLDLKKLDLNTLFKNKMVKQQINTSYEGFGISQNKISLFIVFFKEKIMNAGVQTFIESDECELSSFKKCFYYLDDYFGEFFEQKEKILLAKKFSKLNEKNFFEFLDSIEKINFQNSVKNFEKDEKKISKRVQKNLILFLFKQNFLKEDKKFLDDLKKLLKIVNEIVSDKSFQIYLSKMDNDEVLFDRIFQCVQNDKVVLKTVTCPDYSGDIIQENGAEVFNYNFKTLDGGCGIVASKSFDFVKNMYGIFEKYISNVKIEHCLPTFEFYQSEDNNGFKGKNIDYSYDDCVKKLGESCESIGDRYSKNNLNAKVGTTNNLVVSDELLREKQKSEVEEIISEIEKSIKEGKNSSISKFISEIYKKRNKLYLSWYPKNDGESDKEHSDRISKIIIEQLGEYLVLSKKMTEDENSFVLMSDSVVVQDVYTSGKVPVLYGIGKNVVDYNGAN